MDAGSKAITAPGAACSLSALLGIQYSSQTRRIKLKFNFFLIRILHFHVISILFLDSLYNFLGLFHLIIITVSVPLALEAQR